MVFDERASGRISAHGAILAALLTLVGLPGWTLADPPADAKPAEKSESVSTTTSSQSSTSSATSGAATDPAALVPAEPVSRSYLLGVLKNEDISSNKAAEISLGNGGVIRITKNENGDLVVTVEQTESGNALRFNRVGPATGRVAIDVTARTGTNSNGGIVGSASSDAAPSTAGVFSGAGFGASAGTIRVTTARSSGAGTRAGGPLVGFDREMLQSDIALAEVGVMEKRAELEIARQSKTDDAHVKLAELGLKRAEIELERAKLRLKRSETGSAQ